MYVNYKVTLVIITIITITKNNNNNLNTHFLIEPFLLFRKYVGLEMSM